MIEYELKIDECVRPSGVLNGFRENDYMNLRRDLVDRQWSKC